MGGAISGVGKAVKGGFNAMRKVDPVGNFMFKHDPVARGVAKGAAAITPGMRSVRPPSAPSPQMPAAPAPVDQAPANFGAARQPGMMRRQPMPQQQPNPWAQQIASMAGQFAGQRPQLPASNPWAAGGGGYVGPRAMPNFGGEQGNLQNAFQQRLQSLRPFA